MSSYIDAKTNLFLGMKLLYLDGMYKFTDGKKYLEIIWITFPKILSTFLLDMNLPGGDE